MVHKKSSSMHSDCGANNYKQGRNPIKSKRQTTEQNSVGLGGPLESHSGQGGKVYGSFSHSGCGMGNHKSISSADPKEKESENSLSPSLSLALCERDGERERERHGL